MAFLDSTMTLLASPTGCPPAPLQPSLYKRYEWNQQKSGFLLDKSSLQHSKTERKEWISKIFESKHSRILAKPQPLAYYYSMSLIRRNSHTAELISLNSGSLKDSETSQIISNQLKCSEILEIIQHIIPKNILDLLYLLYTL